MKIYSSEDRYLMIFGYTIYNQQYIYILYIHIIFYNDHGTVRIMEHIPNHFKGYNGI